MVVAAAFLYQNPAEVRGLGGSLSFPLAPVENLSVNPNVAVFFPDQGNRMEFNADLVYSVPFAGVPIRPFALAGFGVTAASAQRGVVAGLNLGGGLVVPISRLRPSLGAKFEIREGNPVVYFARLGVFLGR